MAPQEPSSSPPLDPALPLVSIVVLNWNGLEDTKQCLDSLRHLDYDPFELVLVDNGSSDGSKTELPDLLRALPYPTKLLDLPNNTGFAGGNSAALQYCNGEFIALLNNDTQVDPEWLTALVRRATSDHRIAAVGGKAYFWDNSKHPAHNRHNPFYTYQRIDPYTAGAYTLQGSESPQVVDSISGCAVMIRRSAVAEHGFLEHSFFAYYEETDLFARFLRAGLTVFFEPDAAVWHRIAASTGALSYFYLFHMQRNRAFFAIRNFDRPYLAVFLRRYLQREFLFLAHSVLSGRFVRGSTETRARTAAFGAVIRAAPRLYRERRRICSSGSYNTRLSLSRDHSVSVIIPNYNYGRYVAEAIESALNQSRPPLEIIVVDDGSTDNSRSVIAGYPVKLITQENQGVVAAKNRGFAESRGRFVLFLDSDDRLRPEALETYLDAHRLNPTAAYAYSDMEYFGAVEGRFVSRDFSGLALRRQNFIHNSALIKREAFESVGGYAASMTRGYEDWDLYLSFLDHGLTGQYVPRILLDYRQHPGASRNKIRQEEALEIVREVQGRHPRLFPLPYRAARRIKRDYAPPVVSALLHLRAIARRVLGRNPHKGSEPPQGS